MKAFCLAGLLSSLFSMTFASAAISASRPNSTYAGKPSGSASAKTLFYCRTDRVIDLPPASNGAPAPNDEAGAGRAIKGDIRLTIDVHTGVMTLIVRSKGAARRTYVLYNVEQGSSGGSGAGGRADTTIRGESAGNIFTLSASYEENGLTEDADLQIAERTIKALVCINGRYKAPRAAGIGRFGSTGIFTLSGDGLAKEMKDLPGYDPP